VPRHHRGDAGDPAALGLALALAALAYCTYAMLRPEKF